jgi:thiol-disulfide isomerase/thioredoxin
MKKCATFTLVLLGFSLIACSGSGGREPDIRIVDLADIESALAEHRGEGVILNFWAIWCAPCVEELPELLDIARQYRNREGVVLGVSYDLMIPGANSDEVLQQMREFVAERGIDIPVLIYDADDYDSINERFGIPGPIPATVAIGRDGTIIDRQEGQAGRGRFIAMMENALGN